MNTSRILALAARGGGAFLGWRYAGRVGLPPVVGALVGWLVFDFVADSLAK